MFQQSSHCLKITQNVAFDFFEFWHNSPIFVLLKLTCLVTLFDRKLRVFKNSPKRTIFGIFHYLLSPHNVNVARFARNVGWAFFCDFQTPCVCRVAVPFLHINIRFIHFPTEITRSWSARTWLNFLCSTVGHNIQQFWVFPIRRKSFQFSTLAIICFNY